MAIKPYNGHHCWNCWNVSLWIGNDYGLYQLALYHLEKSKNVGSAVRNMLKDLPARTPDGAKYTFKGVRSALTGLME